MNQRNEDNRTMKEVAAFLLGEASLDGYWFGERHPISPFWWREHLRAALSEIDMTLEAMSAALAAPATAPNYYVNEVNKLTKGLT